VLLLDDELAFGRAWTRALRSLGFVLDAVQEVDEFIRVANTNQHDVLLIDWNLRMCEGTQVCVQRRGVGDFRPIGIISGKLDADHARQIAREAGADGYIEKTTTLDNVTDEINKLIRASETRLRTAPGVRAYRCTNRTEDGATVSIELDQDHVILSITTRIRLRPKEFQLLQALLQRAGRVVSKEELLRVVWGSRTAPTTSIVETSMSRLRTQLGSAAAIIETVPGGYRISVASET
jgi:DNA-binding response OmpR family regulator